jgi:hypothetical protein
MRKLNGLVLAAALFVTLGACNATQITEVEADAHTLATLLAGAASAAAKNPTAMNDAKTIAAKLLKKAGVPAATATKITSAINAGNAAALEDAATEAANAIPSGT